MGPSAPAEPGPIRVLHLLVSTALGGGPKHVFDLLRRLPPRGITVAVAAPADGPFFERFKSLGVEVASLPLNRLSPWTLLAVVRLVREKQIQVIHSHGKGAGLYSRLASLVLGIPAIHTFHGIHYQDYSPMARRLYLALERWLARRTRMAIHLSLAHETEGVALGLVLPSRSVVVPNGIDVAEVDALVGAHALPRSALGLAPEDLVVGSVARFDPVKALDVLLEAVYRLRARVPRLRLVLVGEGPEGTRLRRLAEELGLRSVVTFAGMIEDAPRIFPAWDLYVSASRREGLPFAILEAMACRLPIVATDIPGHREVIVDGMTGLLVPPDDPGTLAEGIAAFLANGARRERLGQAGRARVVEAFSLAAMVRRIEEVYRAAVVS